ncbi:MAG: hypothetical protein V4641_16315 [Pseudomonadota bacterium]
MAKTIKIDGKDWRVTKTGLSVGAPAARADWIKHGFDPDSYMEVECDDRFLPFPIKREARTHVKTGQVSLAIR